VAEIRGVPVIRFGTLIGGFRGRTSLEQRFTGAFVSTATAGGPPKVALIAYLACRSVGSNPLLNYSDSPSMQYTSFNQNPAHGSTDSSDLDRMSGIFYARQTSLELLLFRSLFCGGFLFLGSSTRENIHHGVIAFVTGILVHRVLAHSHRYLA
jgi:hypothetical protein